MGREEIEAALDAENINPTPDVPPSDDSGSPAPKTETPAPAEPQPDGEKKEEVKKMEDDPEFDLGDLGKHKKSALKGWKESGLRQEDYTKKTQELAAKETEIKDLLAWTERIKGHKGLTQLIVGISEKVLGPNGYNEEFINKALKTLEDKAEVVQDKNAEIEEALKSLDPDDPNYKILKQALDKGTALEKKIADIEAKINGREAQETQGREKQQFESQVQIAQKLLSDTLDSMLDANKPDSFKFETEDEGKMWRVNVLTFLRSQPPEFFAGLKDDNSFVAKLREVGKAYYEGISKIGEARLAKHLKSKETPATPTGPAKPEEPTSPTQKPSGNALQDMLEKELQETMKQP